MNDGRERFWIGVCTGHAIPMARTALAGARVTTLDGNMAAMESFLGPIGEEDAGLAADACKGMADVLFSDGMDEWWDSWDGSVVLPESVWLEPMGFDERPDSGDYAIAADMATGDYSYDPLLEEDAALRVGVAQCLDQLGEFIETRTVRGRTRRAA